MAVKYLAGNRLWGTDAERLSMTTGDSMGADGNATNNGADLDTTNEKLGTGCLDFNSSNTDYIDANNLQTNTAMTTKGTIAFWLNLDAVTNGEKVFMISDSNGTDGQIYMEIESSGASGKIMCGCDLGGTAQWAIRMASGLLSATTWYHVALTHDGTSPKVYLNGVDQTTTQVSTDLTKWVSMTSGMDSFGFGRSNYDSSTGAYLNGKFDDIGIWNDALIIGTDEDTADSIKWLYNDDDGRLASTIQTGLRAYYNCDSATTDNNAIDTPPNLPNGATFLTSDTNKLFMFDGTDTWNEVS